MQAAEFWELGRMSDQQLRAELATLLAGSYRTEARIVAHIAEVERRKLHLRDGYPSLFEYCVKQLGLSESDSLRDTRRGEAFHRLTAARIASKFPAVFGLIERREIHLTAVCLLRDYLTQDNHLELLVDACHKTKLQVLELLARRFPRPDVVSRIRKLPNRENADAPTDHGQLAKQASTLLPDAAPIAAAMPAPEVHGHESPNSMDRRKPIRANASVAPTSGARYRIQLNASSALKDKLELLRALTSHSNPSGDLAVAIERAVDLALEQAQKQRFAKTDQPRTVTAAKSRPNPRSARSVDRRSGHREHIPRQVRREVASRDDLQCTYTSESGCRCTARAFLQLHHEKPWALGGETSTGNLRLLCASHNRLLAERDYGAEHVSAKIARRSGNVHERAAGGRDSVSGRIGDDRQRDNPVDAEQGST